MSTESSVQPSGLAPKDKEHAWAACAVCGQEFELEDYHPLDTDKIESWDEEATAPLYYHIPEHNRDNIQYYWWEYCPGSLEHPREVRYWRDGDPDTPPKMFRLERPFAPATPEFNPYRWPQFVGTMIFQFSLPGGKLEVAEMPVPVDLVKPLRAQAEDWAKLAEAEANKRGGTFAWIEQVNATASEGWVRRTPANVEFRPTDASGQFPQKKGEPY